MKGLLLALALVALPELCLARAVAVTTGEHDGFTRLAAVLPVGVAWTVERTPAGFALRVKDGDISFDVSRAFTRITRNRISNLRSEDQGKTLVVEVGCACEIETFTANRNTAVIDIKDALATSNGTGPYLPRAPVAPQQWQATIWRIPGPKPVASVSEPLALLMRRSLQESISSADLFRAIAQNASGPPRVFNTPRNGAGEPQLSSNDPLFAHLQPGPSTAATDEQPHAPHETRPGVATCLIELLQRLPEWKVGGKQPQLGLPSWRKPLLPDGASGTAETVILIARQYLYLGLPEEAALYLGILPTNNVEQQDLLFLVALMSSSAKSQPRGTAELTCGGADARGATDAPDINAAEVRQLHAALLKLPPHLRQFVLPGLKSLFASSTGEVQAMLRELEQGMGGGAAASGGTDASPLPDTRPDQTSDRDLLDLIDRVSDLDAAALSDLLDRMDPARAEALIANMDIPNTPSPFGTRSPSQMAALLARYGRVDEAFAIAGTDPDAAGAIWRIVAAAPSDADLLRFAAGADQATIRPLPIAVRSAVANRLERLGFDTIADNWLPERDAAGVVSAAGQRPR